MAGATDPLIEITKKIAPPGVSCDSICNGAVEGDDSTTANKFDNVTYCYKLENAGLGTLYNVEVKDDACTPSDSSDDVTVTMNDLNAGATTTDVAPASVVCGSYTATMDMDEECLNTVIATGDDFSGGNPTVLSDNDTARVIIDSPANDPPIATDDYKTVFQDTDAVIRILDNDYDVDGNLNRSCIEIIQGPTDGQVEINSDGAVTYAYTGADVGSNVDTFVYSVCDDDGLTANATVYITTR